MCSQLPVPLLQNMIEIVPETARTEIPGIVSRAPFAVAAMLVVVEPVPAADAIADFPEVAAARPREITTVAKKNRCRFPSQVRSLIIPSLPSLPCGRLILSKRRIARASRLHRPEHVHNVQRARRTAGGEEATGRRICLTESGPRAAVVEEDGGG